MLRRHVLGGIERRCGRERRWVAPKDVPATPPLSVPALSSASMNETPAAKTRTQISPVPRRGSASSPTFPHLRTAEVIDDGAFHGAALDCAAIGLSHINSAGAAFWHRGVMASDPEEIRARIRRYRELYRANADKMAREAIEQVIRELERQIREGREEP